MARGGRVALAAGCSQPPGPAGEGLGSDAEAHGSKRAGAGPTVLGPLPARSRSLPDSFTKPVGPAGPREGGSGRESQRRGRGRGSLPPPWSSSRMHSGKLLSGLGGARGRCPGVDLGQEALLHPRPPHPGQQCGALPSTAIQLPSLTVHLALIREDDFPPAAGRVDRQRLLEALLDVRTPHTLGIIVQTLVHAVLAIFPPLPGAAAGVPAVGRYGAGCSGLRPRAPTDTQQPAGTQGTPVRPGDPCWGYGAAVTAWSQVCPRCWPCPPLVPWGWEQHPGVRHQRYKQAFLGGRAMISMSTPQIQATCDYPGSTQLKFGKETAQMLHYPYKELGHTVPVDDTSGRGGSSPAVCEPRPRTSTRCHPAASSGELAPKPPPAPKIPAPPRLAKAEPGFEGRRWAAPSQTPLMGTRWPEPSGSPTPGSGRGPLPRGCSAGAPGTPRPAGDAGEPSTLLLLLLLLPLPGSRRSVLQ